MDPSAILKNIVDEFGDRVKIGDEQDIGEFAMNFLDRMEEGIGETRKFKNDTQDLQITQMENKDQSNLDSDLDST